MIQALGGLVLAVGSAIAISQYALSRAQREDARAVQKSMAYAAALAELSADSETRRLGAVILLKTGVETRSYDKAEVAAVLAQYIRDYAGIPGAGSSIDLAIQTIDAAKPGDSPVNLRGLDLRGRNFRSVNLQHFDLVHADLRGALLPMTDKAEGIPAD